MKGKIISLIGTEIEQELDVHRCTNTNRVIWFKSSVTRSCNYLFSFFFITIFLILCYSNIHDSLFDINVGF